LSKRVPSAPVWLAGFESQDQARLAAGLEARGYTCIALTENDLEKMEAASTSVGAGRGFVVAHASQTKRVGQWLEVWREHEEQPRVIMVLPKRDSSKLNDLLRIGVKFCLVCDPQPDLVLEAMQRSEATKGCWIVTA